jgi:hypothetical protein
MTVAYSWVLTVAYSWVLTVAYPWDGRCTEPRIGAYKSSAVPRFSANTTA